MIQINLLPPAKLSSSTVRRLRHPFLGATNQRGMTLIEIMVVLAIIGLIMGGLTFAFMGWFSESQVDVAKSQVVKVSSVVMNYYLHHQEYPSSLDELSTGKNAKLKPSQLKDPWKEPFVYRTPATRGNGDYDLCSKGPDKREGTDDDICAE